MEVLDWDFIILAFSFLLVSRNVGVFLGWGWGDRGRAFDGILALFLFIYSLHVIVDFSWSFFSSRFVGYAILKICH